MVVKNLKKIVKGLGERIKTILCFCTLLTTHKTTFFGGFGILGLQFSLERNSEDTCTKTFVLKQETAHTLGRFQI
jgi:hypothetical protein